MSPRLLDVLVRAALEATLILSQSLLLNRLGVPFAAITLFAGLGAYVAATLVSAPSLVLAVVVLGLGAAVAFVTLVRPLPADRYLLLSLGALALARAWVGSSEGLGGQLGLACYWPGLPAQRAASFAPAALGLLAAAVALAFALERSELGLAVDVARASREEPTLQAAVSIPRVTAITFLIALVLAVAVGGLRGLYAGRVDPNAFKLDRAVGILVGTLVAGRGTARAAVAAVAFAIFPDAFAHFVGYTGAGAGHVRELLWSGAVIVAAARRTWRGPS